MNMNNFLKITKAEYLEGMKLRLTFNDGSIRVCDFEPLSHKGDCQKLQNPAYFQSFTLDPYTVDWNNEIGFAPEFLYEVSSPLQYQPDSVSSTRVAEPDSSEEYGKR